MTDPHAQFLTVVKVLPRDFNMYAIPSLLTCDGSKPYGTSKKVILKREDLSDRQRLDQLFQNIELQYGSTAQMLLQI